MPSWFVNTFGWGMVVSLIVIAFVLSLIPWPKDSALYTEPSENEYPLDETDLPHGRHASPNDAGQEISS